MSNPAKSLASQLKESIDSRPDKYTLAWWESRFEEHLKAYYGATHLINLSVANTRENAARLDTFQEMLAVFRTDLDAAIVNLGALLAENTTLRADVTAIKKRMDDMSAWAKTKGKQLPDQKDKQ